MATTAVPATFVLLSGPTGPSTNNNGKQTQGLNPLKRALLSAMSTFPSASSTPVSVVSFVTRPQNRAAGAANNLCEQCNVQPKHIENGRVHPYCSKTCAVSAGLVATPQAQDNKPHAQMQSAPLCTVCGVNPRYNDGTVTHLFCGKTCAKKGKQQSNAGHWRWSAGTKPSSKPTGPPCSIPGCSKPAYKDQSGAVSHYCSNAHKKLAAEACLMCHKAPKQRGHFCTRTCADDATKLGPCVLEVPEGHDTFKGVADQFNASWRNASKPCPTVRHVYKVVGTQASTDKYEAYRDAVEARGQFAKHGRSPGNENRRWHGTRRECTFGDKGNTSFCGATSCPLCSIVKTAYNKGNGGQFGAGIYTSSTSSKSDNFSQNRCTSTLKAMLLNKVIVGKGCKMTQNNTGLTAPPAGYDSVLAEKGSVLSDDELVVYTNDAIRPSFLVMYDA